MEAFTLLPDPQTNGGLLLSVKEDAVEEVKHILGSDLHAVGRLLPANEKRVWVKLQG